jgi:hypothetical protein
MFRTRNLIVHKDYTQLSSSALLLFHYTGRHLHPLKSVPYEFMLLISIYEFIVYHSS